MMEISDTLQKLQNLKPHFTDMNIRRMAVFGSQARGTAEKDSDVDLIVDFIKTPGMFDFVRTKNKIEQYLGAPVDLITFSSLKTPRQKSILDGAVDV
jgi:predicted nucleotidyltransferase